MNDYDAFREQVREWTRERLDENPDGHGNPGMEEADRELFREACEAFPELEALSLRQYRARYIWKVRKERGEPVMHFTRRVLSREEQPERPDWVTPPGGGTTREPAQKELFS